MFDFYVYRNTIYYEMKMIWQLSGFELWMISWLNGPKPDSLALAESRQILHGLKAVQDDAVKKEGLGRRACAPTTTTGVIPNPASARGRIWRACLRV
jgi:hypothetical protein